MMKKYLIILLFLLIISFLGGCMPGGDLSLGDLIRLIRQGSESDEEGQIPESAEKPGSSLENETGELVSDNFYTLNTLNDVIDNFSSYEFQHSQSHPIKRFNEKCKINYIGKENIDGIMADKVQVVINAESYEDRGQQGVLELKHNHVYDLWLDQDGLIFKIARDNIMLTNEREMGIAGGHINLYIIGPQGHILLNYRLPLISKVHREYVGWQLVNRTQIKREIGNGSIVADVLDFETADGERKYFEVATVNGKNIHIGLYAEVEDGLRQFQVTRLIPR